MKSSCNKEDANVNKKYVFFSDPDVIAQRAETSAAAAQLKQDTEYQQQQGTISKHMFKDKPSNLPAETDLKDLGNILSYQYVQRYPFTFISAVKRKHGIDDGSEACKKASEPNNKNASEPLTLFNSDGVQNLHEIVQKMDFIRPLKVPDLKISAKKLDFSNRDNCGVKEIIPPKFEASSKEPVQERLDKPSKSFERVQRRLDFSTSDVSSTINSEVEPLKVPNISISSNLSKKKEYIRENSREKENRSKKIRKDDSLFCKQDDVKQDVSKRSRSPRHVSRREFSNAVNENVSTVKVKNDRLPLHMPRESDFVPTKQKTKNFATSTAKKVTDKKHRSINTRSLKSRDSSLESKNRSYSNESLSERSSKIPDQITARESKNMYESFDYRYKDDLHMLKQVDDPKHMFSLENKQIKQHKIAGQSQGKIGNIVFKEQSKRSEKAKPLMGKIDSQMYIMNIKESESVDSLTDSNTSVRTQSLSTVSTQQVKNKDSEKAAQNVNVNKGSKATEDSKYMDDSLAQCTSSNIKKEEESFAQSNTTTATKQTSNSNESNLNDSVLSDTLLDPRRISFRDENRSQQDEFCDLVTPDMNLMPRSKRKRQFMQHLNVDSDSKCSKHNINKTETEQEGIPLLHPSALHMQFQAELHLLDSFNESLRQVMDVEKCLYNVKQDQEKELTLQHNQSNEQGMSNFRKPAEERNTDDIEHCNEMSKVHKHAANDKPFLSHTIHHSSSQAMPNEFDNVNKVSKPTVKAVEVQTQTVNDMATQTKVRSARRSVQSRCSEICGIPYERGFVGSIEIPNLSLDSVEQFEDLDQIEEISLPSKLRTMSEISLHETTSSIRTETGTEISISTRDVTCSFNKYLDLEIAQLIKDEKQRYDKIEMLFKSREKTLNDRTKKLVKLEEQKRALKDTGQDSRVSSVKKKQRALLLKLQQEKDEMNRLKELHKIASQERKLMLQKQRNMFNPQMSTKNILTKLKRSADSQSPRRLSGPMKGYDIRSNSSMSSLVDSDKSQHDRSQMDARMQMTEAELHFSKMDLPKSNKFTSFIEEPNAFFDKSNGAVLSNASSEKSPYKTPKDGNKSKYETKSRKFEEKMPRADVIRLKSHQHSIDPKVISNNCISISGKYIFEKEKSPDDSDLLQQNLNKSISEHVKSESDTLVEELSKKSKPSQTVDNHFQNIVSPRESSKSTAVNSETVPEEISCVSQDTVSKTSKSSQVSEDVLQTHSKNSKRSSKSIPTEMSKKSQYSSESKSNFKRRSAKCQKSKSSSSILTENILRSKSNSQTSEEFIKHHSKRTKTEKELVQFDRNDENALAEKRIKDKNLKLLTDRIDEYDIKENVLCQQMFDKNVEAYENSLRCQDQDGHSFDNASVKSHVSNFTISHHSSGESDMNYTKSVVIRSQDHNLKTSRKLEQILNAREAALTSRKNCVDEWMAWHAKLRTEEDRVARMEQAALKLVTATSNVFSQQDTTVSSDTSDIEGRIELLTEKLAERRIEMSRLKREARKQTKQKLRALEANLLNQIKKYDTTIYEMRKKLESKKASSRDSDKLAIESRSLADFKVPEIPLKKIQDVFKSSDLLRSRSESDLMSSRRLPAKDASKNLCSLRGETVEADCDKNYSEQTVKSSRSLRTQGSLSTAKLSVINRSAQSVFDECISEQIEIDKIGSASVSSVSDDVRFERNVRYGAKQYLDGVQKRQSVSDGRKSSISEDIRTEISGTKSETDIVTQSEAKLSRNEASVQSDLREYKSDFETLSEQSRVRSLSSQSGVNKVQDGERSSRESSDIRSAGKINTESANGTLDFSKKLDFLHLNNQNLNDDISSLENELKILSEMMLRFSKKPNEENKQQGSQQEDKSTSKDISESLSKSNKSGEICDIEIAEGNNRNKEAEPDPEEIISEISQHLTASTKSKSVTAFDDSKGIVEDVDNVISAIIPASERSPCRSISQEIDYKARSKEILNEIGKSISERIKVDENSLSHSEILTENDNLNVSEGKKASHDTSAEVNINSISEIYSKPTEEKEKKSIKESQVPSPAEENVIRIEEQLDIIETRKPSESNDNSTIATEKSNLLAEHNKSAKQSATTSHSSIINDVTLSETRSENKSDATSNQLPQNLPNLVSVAELMKGDVSLLPASPKETIASFKVLGVNYITTTVNVDNNECAGDAWSTSKLQDHDVSHKSVEESKQAALHHATDISRKDVENDETRSHDIFMDNTSMDKDDWPLSDSFDIPQEMVNTAWDKSQSQQSKIYDDNSSAILDSANVSVAVDDFKNQIGVDDNIEVDDATAFIPKCESTTIDMYGMKLDETETSFHIQDVGDDVEDVLDKIVKENDKAKSDEDTVHSIETDDFQKAIYESVTRILDKVEMSLDDSTIKEKLVNHSNVFDSKILADVAVDGERSSAANICDLQCKTVEENAETLGRSDEKLLLPRSNRDENVNEDTKAIKIHAEPIVGVDVQESHEQDEDSYNSKSKSQEIIITELEPGSVESDSLSELEIDAKVELAEEDVGEIYKLEDQVEAQEKVVHWRKSLEPIMEQDSSDGEQLDNLVEVTESGLDVIEKQDKQSIDSATEAESISHDKIDIQPIEAQAIEVDSNESVAPPIVNKVKARERVEAVESDASPNIASRTFDILRDPEYEDISEESLEVSEIFDKSERQKPVAVQKSSTLPQRYEAIQKSDEVLKILDVIVEKPSADSENDGNRSGNEEQVSEDSENRRSEIFGKDAVILSDKDNKLVEDIYSKGEQLLPDNLEGQKSKTVTPEEDQSTVSPNETEEKEKQEQDVLSESSEDRDTPKGVSEIEMDSPRDLNDSRLDIDAMNDDLLNNMNVENQNIDSNNAFRGAPIVSTSEKDIEVMIDKLKASLDQPGVEVADWEAKLLRIEQLQIELEIKKLEAEEESYYVREIPNKPPPPYTPPGGGGRLSTSLGSPSPPPAVIPSNIDELTAFTERATAIIYKAKQDGEDIMTLEAPSEICELTKENDEVVKNDRRIYNTFLFDLCKETIAEVYQAEYEKPGPSWTKPNVKTKPLVKMPRSIDELNDYVNKEVATLFGFKTKLQRENMVMRWSRKRRDRVDELLAREAQAEEAEWTKFHHDELAVKNGLTVTILDTLLMETVNIVKVAYAKKRKVMV